MSESSAALRIGTAVSVGVHLVALIAGLGYAGFLLVPSGPEQTIAVDLVTPQEVAELMRPPEPDAPPAPQDGGDQPPAAAPPPPPPKDALAQATAPRPQAQAAIRAPQPDISVRYPMNLSLFGSTPGEFDAKASSAARIGESDVAAFRARLKTCSTLPADVAPDDKVVIVIRAQFLPDGRLASMPILIEASASAKGPLLMQAAIAALQSCQPHLPLPADKYQEWKLLDLSFTPLDFTRR
ncbi:MAG: hypothetical protein JWR73_1344 [Tardiphaga sp.]|nr:hypothetical protein [Tardiphaga sp.]